MCFPEVLQLCRMQSHSPPSPKLQDVTGAQPAEQRLCAYLAGPLWATGAHIKWPRTLYPTRHRATRVGTRPSRLQASWLHDPGLHGPGFQHSRLQDPWLQSSCLQGSRFHHPGLQPSWLQPSRISSNCRGKTRQDAAGCSTVRRACGASPLPPLSAGWQTPETRRVGDRGDMPGGSPLPCQTVPAGPGVSHFTARTPSYNSRRGSGLCSDFLPARFKPPVTSCPLSHLEHPSGAPAALPSVVGVLPWVPPSAHGGGHGCHDQAYGA